MFKRFKRHYKTFSPEKAQNADENPRLACFFLAARVPEKPPPSVKFHMPIVIQIDYCINFIQYNFFNGHG